MEKSQAEFLHTRIKDVKHPPMKGRNRYGEFDASQDTAAVKRAREVIHLHEQKLQDKADKQTRAFNAARLKALEAVHAGNYEKALAAVQRFESQYGIEAEE